MKLFEFIVHRRFYIWNGDIYSIVYECMDEEGAGVKKKITQGTEVHCKRFLAEAQKQWKEWLESNFTLSTTGSTEHPPTAMDIEAKLPKPKMKKKPNKKEGIGRVYKTPNVTITSTDSFDPEQR